MDANRRDSNWIALIANAVVVLVGFWMMLVAAVPLHVALIWVALVVVFLVVVAVIISHVRRG